jgi:hypothetical protein
MNTEVNMQSNTDQLQILQDLIINNPELEQLETLLAQFNIFEALRAVNVELRHSDFLAYLLDPQQNHGFGDAFVRRLLQVILLGQDPASQLIRPIDLDLWDLDNLEVRREWQNIDILLLSQTHHFAVVIENKIDSSEHSGQLQRYRKTIHQFFPNWQAIFLFLTPDGGAPTDETYLSVDYGQIANIIEGFAQTRQSTLGPDVRVLMQHYVQMLRRHIVSDSEIARLCREIYRKHKTAIDLINQHIPDRQAAMKEEISSLIVNTPGMIVDRSVKTEIDFVPSNWDTPTLMKGSGWTQSGRMLMLAIDNDPNQIRIMIYIGPGPVEIRQKLLEIAQQHQPPFRSAHRALRQSWNNIYVRPVISKRDMEEMEFDELVDKFKTEWKKFLQGDLKTIDQILRQHPWIWEGIESA